jgi:hypothetical protein
MSSALPGTSAIPPVVVDLGKPKRKDVRALKRGEGKLMEDVNKVIEEIRANSSALANKELVPVVVLYRRESRRKSMGMFPFNFGR